MARYTSNPQMLNAVTATTTSAWFDVSERRKLSIQVKAASITSGNAVFTINVSNDGGVTATAYNRITTNATNTNAQTDARVASVTLSSNGSQMIFFPAGDHFQMIQIVATVTTDGAYTATLAAID